MQKNIFNLSSHSCLQVNSAGFLENLANWVLGKYPDPLYLAKVTILLPSRRSCAQLKKMFLQLSENEAVILPNILAIGDVDYDDVLQNFAIKSGSKLEYKLELILAIKEWNQKTNLFGENISTASLANVADNLQQFLDEVEKEGLDLSDLSEIYDGEMASHKQQILQFLQYFSSVWQNLLLKKGLISKSRERNLMLENYNSHLQENAKKEHEKFPIICAGSTGSVFAAANLLKTISRLENGSVVLFGLDSGLDEEIWEKIGENHPQFMLKKLLERLEVGRGEIEEIGENRDDFVGKLLSLAMLPAQFSEGWKNDGLRGLFEGFGLNLDLLPLPESLCSSTLPQGEGYETEFGFMNNSQKEFGLNNPPPEGGSKSEAIRGGVTNLEIKSHPYQGNAKPFIKAGKFYSEETLSRSKELRQHQTNPEILLWYYLKNKQLDGHKFRRQQAVGKYIADFICFEEKLIIELDGGQHSKRENLKYDLERDLFLKDSGFEVLRFVNDEVFRNCEGVLDFVLAKLNGVDVLRDNRAALLSRDLLPLPESFHSSTLPQGEGYETECGFMNNAQKEFGLNNPPPPGGSKSETIRGGVTNLETKPNPLQNIKKIELKNEFEEAKIIAILLREALEDKGKTAALISNNKNLNQLVKANLLAWNINIDDSSSSNLLDSKIVNYLFLISKFSDEGFSAVNLLGILKHGFCNKNEELLAILELETLRNVVKFADFEDLILKVKNDDLKKWLQEISHMFAPVIAEFKKKKIDFKKMVQIHFECFEKMQNSGQNSGQNSEQNSEFAKIAKIELVDGKMELLEFFNEILNSKINFSLEPESYNQLLQNFLKDYSFRKSGDFHPRLHILSTMEARLLTQDLTIVSGLLEGSFPSQTSGDWLGNKIRSEVGMTSHARRIGVEAYDFCNYLQGREVVLTHPLSQNNSPTLKSRFLLKLETVLKINGLQEFLNDGKEYLHLLELKNDSAKTESRTNPKPAQKLPRLSATDISKWIRNPYYIYAKRILNLKPLKQIEQEASFAEFGNFVHKALEEFVENYPKIDLLDYGRKIFSDYFPDKTSHLLWFAKFENIAKWFVAYEETLRENLQESFVEVEVEALIGDILTTTKIDRVNLYQDGSMEIIDYKTGAVPSIKDVKSGLEPQLPVEGLILMCGKIKNYPHLTEKIGAGGIGNLQYQNVKGNDQSKITNFADAGDLIFAADEGVKRLIAMFENEDFGYICAPNLDLYKQDDYWHLGRIGEL